jgi:hypothetical protein
MKYLFASLFLVLSAIPFVTYLVYYYRRLDSRRQQLLQTLLTLSLHNEYMLMRYKDRYKKWKDDCKDDQDKAIEVFEKEYFNPDFRAGHSHQDFLLPVLLLTIFTSVGWFLVWNRLWGSYTTLPGSIVFGFIGTYLACLFDIFGGFRREDLVPSDYYSTSFKILFSTFAAYVTTFTIGAGDLPLVAFGIGLIPVTQIFEFISDRATSTLGMTKKDKDLGLDLAKIQGLEHSHSRQKLLDMDITSIQGLATADPLRVYLRTSFPMRTVLDMMDKAILYLYLEDKVVELRKHGINGVIELVALARLATKETAYQGRADNSQDDLLPLFKDLDCAELLKQIATVIGQTPEELKAFIYNMYYDPVVKLIYEIWGRYLNPPDAPQPTPIGNGNNKPLIPAVLAGAETQQVGG